MSYLMRSKATVIGIKKEIIIDEKYQLHELLRQAYSKLENIINYLNNTIEYKLNNNYNELLLRKDLNSESIPLHIACNQIDSINIEIISFLIENNKESILIQNKYGLNPLHCALLNGKNPNIKIIQLLCEKSDYKCLLQPNKQKMLPLHICLKSPRNFDIEIIKLLLIKYIKEQLIYKDSWGYIPLHHGITNKNANIELIEYLLSLCPKTAKIQDNTG